jgi:serine/threonine-protein kinase
MPDNCLHGARPHYRALPYRLQARRGCHGCGVATDTRLNREVAIKILPPAFAEDAARLARFTREAQVLASLNHPNIAAIYGVEEQSLVLELVEGPTVLCQRKMRS